MVGRTDSPTVAPSPRDRLALRIGSLACLGIGAATIVVYLLFLTESDLGWWWYCGIGVVGAAVTIGASWGDDGRPWRLIGFGLGFWVLGEVVYAVQAVGAGADPLPPTWADLAYLLSYPLQISGVMLLLMRRSDDISRTVLIDALIVAFGSALVVWLAWAGNDDDLLARRLVGTAYPAADLLMFVLVLRIIIGPGRRVRSLWLLAAATIALLAADLGYLFQMDSYVAGTWIDAAWLAHCVMVPAAALHPAARWFDMSGPDMSSARLGATRIVLLGMAVALTPTVLLVELLNTGRVQNLLAIAIGALILGLLVVVRLCALVLANIDHARREQSLRAVSDLLAGAADTESIDAAAQAGIEHLLGRRSPATVTLYDRTPAGYAPRGGGDAVLPLDTDEVDGSVVVPMVPGAAGAIVVDRPLGLDAYERAAMVHLSALVGMARMGRRATESAQRRRGEERLQSVVRHVSDLIFVLADDTSIVFTGAAAAGRFSDTDLVGTALTDLVHPADRRALTTSVDRIARGASGSDVVEIRLLGTAPGEWQSAEAVLTRLEPTDGLEGVLVTCRDLTERRVLLERLRFQAQHDSLTGLPNRESLREALARLVGWADGGVGLLFIDLDGFRALNERLGHATGDRLLKQTGARLAEHLPGCLVARLSGDEFGVLIELGADRPDALATAEAALDVVRGSGTDPRSTHVVALDASIGIAYANTGAEAEHLVRNAEIAMYAAKAAGRGRTVTFEPSMRDESLDRHQMREALMRALADDTLMIRYQPLVDTIDEAVWGAEALARWTDPERGEVTPDVFVPLAEESDLVLALGRHMLAKACRDAAAWTLSPSDGPIVSVNLSGRHVGDAALVADVRHALEVSGLAPDRLMVEITEASLVSDIDLVRGRLAELRRLGVRVAIDDFGTGYSSLSYLHAMPVDVLKIDRAFVERVDYDDQSMAVVRSIVDLSRALGLTVIAEGIESPSAWRRIQSTGCRVGQGWLFSRPVTTERMAELVREPKPAAVVSSD